MLRSFIGTDPGSDFGLQLYMLGTGKGHGENWMPKKNLKKPESLVKNCLSET